jgi:hypothetical protein
MSCAPTWTADDLAALDAAIASGAKKVKYSDREIEYQSLSDMLKVRGIMRAALGCPGATLAAGRTYGGYSKGLC